MPLAPVIPPELPDIEVLVLNWLNGQKGLAANAVIADARFCTDLPFIEPGTPGAWVRILRVSGATHSFFTDRPVTDIDVYSFDRSASWAIARAIRNLFLWQLRSTTTPDGTVQTVSEVIGPRWIPDENQDMSRIGASYEIHTRS